MHVPNEIDWDAHAVLDNQFVVRRRCWYLEGMKELFMCFNWRNILAGTIICEDSKSSNLSSMCASN